MDSPHVLTKEVINFNITTKTKIVSGKLQTAVFFF